jgi:glucitol operon activator protein
MRFWQEALGLLAVLWASQAFGSWAQMTRYRDVMQSVVREWPDGCVGVSAARSTFGKGVIAIVVASPDAIVRQVFLMEGRSVFAKFQEFSEGRGGSLATLATEALGAGPKGRQKALAGAVTQIKAALKRRAMAEAATTA